MDDFASESSLDGVIVFHSSEPKKVRRAWLFVYFLFLIPIGFYVSFIYTRCKLEPEFSYELSEFPLQEIPFPAVTYCSPLFARNQSVNLQKFLKNPTRNFSIEQQNILAANVQACAPELGSKIHQFYPFFGNQNIVKILESKFLDVNDAFKASFGLRSVCTYNDIMTNCSNNLNKVLTDFGFCFTFNLESFTTIFNTEIISDDFKSYSRTDKIVKNYYPYHPDHKLKINDENQSIDWNLEKGYLTDLTDTLPVRALYNKLIQLNIVTNETDVSNLCPKMGKSISFFLHMPNEILTPFHRPFNLRQSFIYTLKAKRIKVDESLRPFPPQKRNCYFEGERKLKFFKTYTKALCEFECLTNFTLVQCGCVKFSMPREKSTRICGLNETSCYIQVSKNWNLTCGCLQPCTYIEYDIEKELTSMYDTTLYASFVVALIINFENIFGESIEIQGNYDFYSGLADFGGMLGALFGVSLISLIEIFYFWAMNFIKNKSNIQESNSVIEVSQFASSSTIHGVQFIFDKRRHKLVRVFWILAFFFAFSCCIYDSRESYWKLNVVPETESTIKFNPIEEIPFPTFTVCSPLFQNGNITVHPFEFGLNFLTNESVIKNLSSEQYYYLLTNSDSSWLFEYIKSRKELVQNITVNVTSHRSEIDLFPYLYKSHFEVDEIMINCNFQGNSVPCSKLFKKVMTIRGMCYVFNLQSYQEIFSDGLSKNFDSYGKFEKQLKPQWSLDQGYFTNKTDQHPVKASQNDSLQINFKVPRLRNEEIQKVIVTPTELKVFTSLSNELLTHVSTWTLINFNTQTNVKMSAKKKKTIESFRKFLPTNRGCYFQDERKLKFFRIYTRSNCLLECLTNYILKMCNCVSFLLPHTNISTRICDSADEIECNRHNQDHFPPLNDSLNPCDCLPTCNKIEYSLQADEKELKEKIESCDILNLKFQFGSSEVIEVEINVAYGFQDFLTNVGGFFGLYLGCSVISIIEVFYYLFAFFYRKLTKQKNKIAPASEDHENKENSDDESLSHNNGLTLAEIFDLEEFFRSPAIFGPKSNDDEMNEELDNNEDFQNNRLILEINAEIHENLDFEEN